MERGPPKWASTFQTRRGSEEALAIYRICRDCGVRPSEVFEDSIGNLAIDLAIAVPAWKLEAFYKKQAIDGAGRQRR